MKFDWPPSTKVEENDNKHFTEKSKNLDSAVRFFSEPKNLVDEKQKALDFFTEEISNISKEEVLSVYQKIIDQKKFTLSKNNIKILYFAFTKLEGQEQKNKLLQIAKDLEKDISSPMLHFYAEEMINLMDGTKKENSFDKVISKISKDRYGAIFEDGNLYLSDTNESEIVSEKLKLIKQPTSYEEDQARIRAVRDVSNLLLDNGPINSKKLHNSGVIDSEQDINFQDQYDEYLGFLDNISKRVLLEKFGFNFNDLTLPEQFQFISFIKDQTLEKVEPIMIFSKKFKNNGFRTFLSIEQGGKEMGDKIISLGEKLPEDVAQKVFTKYGEILDNVSKITEFARTNFTKEIETNPELTKKIEETLYIKGKQLLSQTYDDINNKKEVNYEDISKQLDRINADTITTFAIFKQAVKNGEKLPIESIEGSVFSKKEAIDIGDNQQNEMLELYESNWKNHPDRNFVESLKSYFKTAFTPEDNKQKNYFYTFEKDNNIRAFVRFEKQNDASFYASALNVDEASKNFGLGEAMMDEALTREAKEHILHASCRKDNPSNMRYFEKGFISRGFKKTNETEEFDLIWDENKNKDIKAKQKFQEELISMYGNTSTEEIEIRKSKDLESLHGNLPEGKSLVRCFVNNGEWYAVYEVIKDDYGINLGETK